MLQDYQTSAPQIPGVTTVKDTFLSDNSASSSPVSPEKFYKTIMKDLYIQDMYAKTDAQNQLNIAAYNNAYNYWLWQQQTEYNSPANQMARLKAAGLNPNYNSIDGTGNISNIPSSNASLKSNFLGAYQAGISSKQLALSQAQGAVAMVNDLIGGVSKGLSSFVNTPSNIRAYRKSLSDAAHWTAQSKASKASVDNLISTVIGMLGSGRGSGPDSSLFGDHPESNPIFQAFLGDYQGRSQRGQSAMFDTQIKELIKEWKQYEKDNIWDLHKEKLNNQIHNLLTTGELLGHQNDWYDIQSGAGVGNTILNALLAIGRLLVFKR